MESFVYGKGEIKISKMPIENYRGDALVIPGDPDLNFIQNSLIHRSVKEFGRRKYVHYYPDKMKTKGEEVFEAFSNLASSYEGKPVYGNYGKFELGSAFITSEVKLKTKHIIYCVTLISNMSSYIKTELIKNEIEIISAATRNALSLCSDHNLNSIGFSMFRTYPRQEPAQKYIEAMMNVFIDELENNAFELFLLPCDKKSDNRPYYRTVNWVKKYLRNLQQA